MHPTLPLTGRREELACLRAAWAEARAGRGQLWLLCGEAGIGKTRLVQELAREAEGELQVLFGGAWEAGGAPAYWPWTQALRELLRGRDDASLAKLCGSGAIWLGQMLPELRQRLGLGTPPALDPDQARFQLMDAVASLLHGAASAAPILLVLEDLHAADPSSVLLLDFFARELRATAVLVVATYRDVEARAGSVGALLSGLSRHGHVLPLTRLPAAGVSEMLEHVIGARVDDAVLAAVCHSSEGNPLFVGEMARWLARGGDVRSVPEGVRGAIRARLAALPQPTRECLAQASVIGRDFGLDELDLLVGAGPEPLASSLEPALDAALVTRGDDQRYRFSHDCVREVLHDDLPGPRRWQLHLTLADALESRFGTSSSPSHAELAHHLYEAGPAQRGRALEACERAARHALSQLALDDAAVAYERALAMAPADLPDARRVDLCIGLGQARTFAGQVEPGRQAFEQALAMARQCQQPELLARAALALGSELIFAEVDPGLVATLREALAALGSDPSPLRAEVMARLSAALQPAADPSVPIAMAREAISLARQVGDAGTLLTTLRYGGSSLMDLVDPCERRPLNAELAELAERLGSPLDGLRAHQRLAFDHVELGDRPGVLAAVETCDAIATTLAHPVYRARAHSLWAMLAIHDGRFARAEEHLAQAGQLAAKTSDRNLGRALALQRLTLARLCGERARMREHLAELEAVGLPRFGTIMADVLASEALGDSDPLAARARFGSIDAAQLFGTSDASLMEPLIYASDELGDARWMDALLQALSPRLDRFVSWGAFGMSWGPPVAYLVGMLERLRGQPERAVALLVDAEVAAERVRGAPHAAWCAFERARALRAAGHPGDAERTLREVQERATALGLLGLAERVRTELAAEATAPRSHPSAPPGALPASSIEPRSGGPDALRQDPCSLERDGETWLLRQGGRQLRLKDTKGVRLLARLLAEPGREFHVLDLSEALGAPAQPGLELIDARARAEYGRRVEALREELSEAERFHDLARSEGLRAELDRVAGELARAVGLGGRQRKTGDAAERARVNVQRRLRDAIERIRELDSAIGKHLDRALRTGTFCSYDPA